MTDKATVQIPAMYSGVITKLHYQTGDIAKVHQPLFAMDVGSNNVASTQVENTESGNAQQSTHPEVERPVKSLASQAIRRRAKESGIDINQIVGSGPKGRVLKDDIVKYNPEKVTRTDSSPLKIGAGSSLDKPSETLVMRGLQAAMAKHMAHAWAGIPHFTVSDECIMDNLITLKKTLSAQLLKLISN